MEIVERRWCARWLDVQISDEIDGLLPTTTVCTSRRPSMELIRTMILYHLSVYPRNCCCLAPSISILIVGTRLSPTTKPYFPTGPPQDTSTLMVDVWQTFL